MNILEDKNCMSILEDKFDIREYRNNQQVEFSGSDIVELNKAILSQNSIDTGKLVQYTKIDKGYIDEYVQNVDNEQFTQVVTKEEFDDLNTTVERMQKLTRDLENHIYYLENKMFELEKKVKELEWPVNDEEK